jgi:hypothetical protein
MAAHALAHAVLREVRVDQEGPSAVVLLNDSLQKASLIDVSPTTVVVVVTVRKTLLNEIHHGNVTRITRRIVVENTPATVVAILKISKLVKPCAVTIAAQQIIWPVTVIKVKGQTGVALHLDTSQHD